MIKEINNSHTHLTLDERKIILTGITNGSTKTAIAQIIGKDKSTIAKEIKLHRTISHKCGFPLECANYRKCPFGENAQQIVPSIRRFTATDETDPPEHVMVYNIKFERQHRSILKDPKTQVEISLTTKK